MKIQNTYEVKIYVGFLESHSGVLHTIEEAKSICQKYVDAIGLCVTVTETNFIYTKGNEPGVIVGLINYPRYPEPNRVIREHAYTLAKLLMGNFNQKRVSVVCSQQTYMLENDEMEEDEL